MNRKTALKIINMEFKKIMKNPVFQTGVLLACLAAFLIGREGYYAPENFGIKHVISFYGLVVNIVIYYFSAKMLGEDFDLKTSTLIFSGRLERSRIYKAKIISFISMGIVLGSICAGVSIVGNLVLNQYCNIIFAIQQLGQYIVFYASYSLAVGGTALLVTTVYQKMITVLSVVVICYSVLPEIIGTIQLKFPVVQGFTKLIPFYGGWLSLSSAMIELQSLLGLVLFGVLFFIVTLFVADKQDFK